MRPSAALVVAVWGIINGLLVAMLAGFGEQGAVVALYGGAAALVGIIAIAVWAGTRRRRHLANPARPVWHAANGDSVVILAIGILIAALGLAFYPYLALAAVPLLILSAAREFSARKSRSMARATAGSSEPLAAAAAGRGKTQGRWRHGGRRP